MPKNGNPMQASCIFQRERAAKMLASKEVNSILEMLR
jgi:hypothetical protein